MIMDPRFRELSARLMNGGFEVDEMSFLDQNLMNMNGVKVEQGAFLDQNPLNRFRVGSFLDHNLTNLPTGFSPVPSSVTAPSASVSQESRGDSSEDCEIFSDIVLNYINQMLMEEDMEEKGCMYQECSALQAAEKPFYDILNPKYPPSPDQPPLYCDLESPDTGSGSTEENVNSSGGFDSGWVDSDFMEYPSVQREIVQESVYVSGDYNSQSLVNSNNSIENVVDGVDDSLIDKLRLPRIFSESEHVWQFKKGQEEASKFLPNGNLMFDLGRSGFLQKPKEEAVGINVKVEKKEEKEQYVQRSGMVDDLQGLRRQKNPHREDDLLLEEGRSNKQSAVVYSQVKVEPEDFDKVLLCAKGQLKSPLASLQEVLQNGVREKAQQNGPTKGSNGAKSRGKKQGKKEVVDLRALLIQCAQAVATDDRRTVNEVLKQIRQHSSSHGDGAQRLAHYFAESLEARLAGTGSQIYTSRAMRTTAADILKAYHLYLAACPFKKLSHFFANQTIFNVSENATRLHIIDFGILYGFQWPCLIQRLSGRAGGPPHLRITGIDFPQPGFRPTERIEETGNRLRDYARRFNVPFEYNAIAAKWETIKVEDLDLDSDEVLVVNCLFRFKNLVDETVVVDSPRNAVLNVVRRMNPQVFIHGVVNGAYNAPFFITRFREALFHFSALFDMLETNVPRECPERILIERDIMGREALNVIACEGSERIERPETYKQWQVRMQRAGFTQLPLNQEIVKKARDRVKATYHKDFIVDEDGRWMLQGWKGRILYALTTLRPDRVSY